MIPQLRQLEYKTKLLAWMIIPMLAVIVSINYVKNIDQNIENMVLGTPQQVEAQPLVLTEEPTVLPSIPPFTWEGTGLITLWFDDGWKSQYTEGYRVLSENGLVGAIAIPTRLIGWDSYMDWTQVKKVQHDGWEITVHTRNHLCHMDPTNHDLISSEIEGAKKDLDRLNLRSDIYVEPCGMESDFAEQLVRKTFTADRTSDGGFNPIPVTDPYAIEVQVVTPKTTVDKVKNWIAQARDNRYWLILLFHQIDESDEEYGVKPEVFFQMVAEVKQSRLPVVLPSQVLKIGEKN